MSSSVLIGEDGGKKDGDTMSIGSRSSIGSRGSLSMDDDWCVLTEAAVNKELVLDMENTTEVGHAVFLFCFVLFLISPFFQNMK